VSNVKFITYPIETDSRVLMQQAFDLLQTRIPGWVPSEGQLDVWMVEAFSSEAADIGTLATEVPKAIFRFFGNDLFAIPSVEASNAVVTTTWFAVDSKGYTIEAGTQFGIRDSSGDLHAFVTLSDVAIPFGSTQTTAGQITGVATIPGSQASELGTAGATIELIDPLIWVDHITQTGPSSGGEDAESDDDYLDRLSVKLQTISPRPILPNDFSILARDVPGVQRATTLDTYDPETGTYGNERMITIVAVDEDGLAIPDPIQTDLQTYLDNMREINFIVNTMDPTTTAVDVIVSITVYQGYDPIDVASRVQIMIDSFLDPAIWGIDPNDNADDPKTWTNIDTIYYLELATAINNVAGVNRVTSLVFGISGGSLAAADLVLPGVVPLPNPGQIQVNLV
jgi:Baseplate J-like protein